MSNGLRVLVVDDEPDLRALLSYNLEAWGYDVTAVESGQLALQRFEQLAPELVLLDLMLPDMSGLEVCRRIRRSKGEPAPIIFVLTARGDEMDRVVGFEVGADDYLVKPFSVRELMLRMSARLKARSAEPPGTAARSAKAAPPGRRHLTLGPLDVDPDGFHVFVQGEEIHVSALEMRLLVHLLESRGFARSRQNLLTEVWGYQPDVCSRTVDAHVKRLRDKLGPAGCLIETVRGLGYRISEEREQQRDI